MRNASIAPLSAADGFYNRADLLPMFLLAHTRRELTKKPRPALPRNGAG